MRFKQTYSRREDTPEDHTECSQRYEQLEEKYTSLKAKYAELKFVLLNFFLTICARFDENATVQCISPSLKPMMLLPML